MVMVQAQNNKWTLRQHVEHLLVVVTCSLVAAERTRKFFFFVTKNFTIKTSPAMVNTVYLLILQVVSLVVFVYCFALLSYLQLITFEMQHRLLRHFKEKKFEAERKSMISFSRTLSSCYVQIV